MDLLESSKFTESLDPTKLYCPYCNTSMEESYICDRCGYYAITQYSWPNVREEFLNYNKEWFDHNKIIL